MSARIAAQGFSFLGFYSCTQFARSARPFSSKCLHVCNRVPNRRQIHTTRPLHAPKNPYDVLGVNRDATPAEIKKTYFSLARKYHPDTNPDKNARDKFQEIQEAYDTLKDDKKRAAYDQYGSTSQQPGFDPNAFRAGGFSGFEDLASAFGGSFRSGPGPSSNLFEELFGAFGGGGGSRRSGPKRGADLETTIGISFLDACKGIVRKVTISPVVNCGTCSGSGLRPGAKRSTCTTCGGVGTRTFVIDSGFQMQSTCPTCSGLGSTVPRNGQCSNCDGVGKVRSRKTVEVNIPAGVEDGMTIRVPNAGDAPVTGKGNAGDLLVRVTVATSQVFVRQGSNLYHEAKIPMHTALLGGKARVPTLDGDVEVRVPAGTQQGEEMLLKGRGVPKVYGGDSGDLFVTFSVVLPRSLTKRQRQLLQDFADDVEGKSTSMANESTPTSPSKSQKTEETQEPLASENDNGTTSFHQHSPPSGGWVSSIWQRIRGLIGF